ncbi:MAG: 4Fe-4S single cluster domain-containing protein [Desulfuromonadales bacterium]
MPLNVAQILTRSVGNGPGERFVIWVQGCAHGCPGCWNPEMLSFAPQNLRDPYQLVYEVLSTKDIEGVTFTGGEPFAQAKELSLIAHEVRDAGLSVFVFTGYELDELIWDEAHELLSLTDVLVTGRYVQSLVTSEVPWRGSTNQQIIFLTDRYGSDDMPDSPIIEFHISDGGAMTVTGFPLSKLLFTEASLAKEG